MPFNVERLGQESIIILTITGSFEGMAALQDYQEAVAQIARIAAEIEGPVYRITDGTAAQINFGNLVMALGEARFGDKGSVSDPRMKSIFVGKSDLMQLAAQSLSQKQYGHLNITLCDSLDNAVALAREQLEAGS